MNSIKGYIFLVYFLVVRAMYSYGAPPATYPSNGSGGGDWVNNSSWSGSPNLACATASNDTYEILGGDSIYTTCITLSFTGSVNIIIRSGGVLYVGGSGGIGGSVNLTIEHGGKLIVDGDLALSGSSEVDNNGSITVGGDVTGPGKTFDCDGSLGSGTVDISGSGCDVCTDGGSDCVENSTLPIELLSFSASLDSEIGVLFAWATVSEVNNSHFTIEYSQNGEYFEAIAHVNGAGNSEEIINYGYHHPENFYGTSYFRLKQADFDGQESYSHIVTLEYGQPEMLVFPNPSEGEFDIVINGLEGDIKIQVIDQRGVSVYAESTNLNLLNSRFKIDFQQLVNSGNYLLKLTTNDKVFTERLVIY